MGKIRPRLLRKSKLLRYSTLVTLMLSAILFGILYFFKVEFDRNLGVTGFFFGAIQLLYSKLESKNPRLRNVVFLSKSKSSFSQNIYKGLRNTLEINRDISLRAIFPEKYGNADDIVSWQIDELKHNPVLTKADAIVLIPAKDEVNLWQSLVTLTSKGVTVICVDVKPRGSFFDSSKLPRPYFISSDFSMGGMFLGRIIEEELDKKATSFIGATGPENSWPAVERCSKLLSSIVHIKDFKNSSWVKFDSWDSEYCANILKEKISSLDINKIERLLIFAGNDKVAIALVRKLPLEVCSKLKVIGYDGLKDESDELVLNKYEEFLATIDTLPIEQGKSAGLIIENIHKGDVPDFKSHYVKPKILKNQNNK